MRKGKIPNQTPSNGGQSITQMSWFFLKFCHRWHEHDRYKVMFQVESSDAAPKRSDMSLQYRVSNGATVVGPVKTLKV